MWRPKSSQDCTHEKMGSILTKLANTFPVVAHMCGEVISKRKLNLPVTASIFIKKKKSTWFQTNYPKTELSLVKIHQSGIASVSWWILKGFLFHLSNPASDFHVREHLRALLSGTIAPWGCLNLNVNSVSTQFFTTSSHISGTHHHHLWLWYCTAQIRYISISTESSPGKG